MIAFLKLSLLGGLRPPEPPLALEPMGLSRKGRATFFGFREGVPTGRGKGEVRRQRRGWRGINAFRALAFSLPRGIAREYKPITFHNLHKYSENTFIRCTYTHI